MLLSLNNANPCCAGLVLGWVTKYEYPVLWYFFFLFFPFLSQGDLLGTAELPSLRNVVSSIYQLFVPHFAMAVFMCIYLHCRINKRRDTSFEYSSILSTVDLSKHLITAWVVQKFIKLVYFVTFSVFFFFFGNRFWSSLYVRTLSGNELLSQNRLL